LGRLWEWGSKWCIKRIKSFFLKFSLVSLHLSYNLFFQLFRSLISKIKIKKMHRGERGEIPRSSSSSSVISITVSPSEENSSSVFAFDISQRSSSISSLSIPGSSMFQLKRSIATLPLEVILIILARLPIQDLLDVCLWSKAFRDIIISSPVTLLSRHLAVTLDPFKMLDDIPDFKTMTGQAYMKMFNALSKIFSSL
jgi:hypothetical protein